MKKPPYDDVDMFLALNWWVMCVPGLEDEPGLRAWSGKAGVHLLEHLGVYRAAKTPMLSREKWYRKRCRQLNLSPFRPSYVLDLSREAGGKWIVKKGQTHRIIWPNGHRDGDVRDEYWHDAGPWYWRDSGPSV